MGTYNTGVCVAAAVWPVWLLSLQVGVVFAADGVADLMRVLDPEKVTRDFVKTPVAGEDTESPYRHGHTATTGSDVLTASQAAENWKTEVECPGAMLVSTMEELSAWGAAMSWSIIGCLAASLGMLPTAVADDDRLMIGVLIVLTSLPLSVAYSPVRSLLSIRWPSSAIATMLDI
jgi:hypothetical protein